jgi:lipopolysaccharide biosynthesis regulator YciM
MATVKQNPADNPGGPDPAAAIAAIASARQSLAAGDPDAAAVALRHVATRNDAPPAQLVEAAKVYADAGSPVDAVSRYLEAGRGYLQAGDIGQARQSFASAYEVDGKSMDALFELGRCDVAEGKKHDGLDKFVEVLRKSNLKHLPALYEAGCLYEQDGQHNQAILAFKRVVDRDKLHTSALEHLASLHQVRNQMPDAVGYYVRAAESALAQFHHADAKRLAEAALALDGGSSNARRVLADAEKSAAAGPPSPADRSTPVPARREGDTAAASAPPAQPATAAAPPTPPAHPASPVSEVTPVAPPSAEGAVPPPSAINIGLAADVALLEQQSHAMAQLAQVQNAVAQTYKQRIALDEEIRKAQAALEALHRQQQSVDEELSGKRDELAKVVSSREAEEANLAALGDAINAVKSQLDALGALPALVTEVRAKCASAAEGAAKAAADVDLVIGQTAETRGRAAAADGHVKEVQAKLAAVRQAADAVEKQLTDVGSSAKSATSAADEAAAKTAGLKALLESLASKRAAAEAAGADLIALSGIVEQKRAEADGALARLQALQTQRSSQFEEIIFKLPPLAAASRAASAPVAPAPPAAAAAPASRPAAAPLASAALAPSPAASGSVEALIAAGKFAEAAQRAQTEANAQPKPADYLVDTGAKLRAAGKLDEAAKLFAAARDRDQKSARARYELGVTCADLGRVDDALAHLQSVEGDPQFSVLGMVAVGKCLRKRGDIEGAEGRFAKALEIEGKPEEQYHEALYQLADLHESKGDPESLGLALWSYEELQSGNPNYGDVAARVAKLKSKLGEAGTRAGSKPNGAVKQ